MPETGAAIAAYFGTAGAGAAAAEGAGYVAAGEAASAGISAAGGLAAAGTAAGTVGAVGAGAGFGSSLAGLGADAEIGAAGASFGAGAGGATLAGDSALGYGIAGAGAESLGSVGGGAAAGAAGAQSPTFMQSLQSLFGPNSTGGKIAGLFQKGGQGLGMVQVLSGLYGMDQSKKLQRQASQPGMTAAGLQAVQRSMAAQGYQGSGNMAAALEKYGAQTNMPNLPGTEAALTGQLSSLGLLTSGLPQLAGWGNSTPQNPQAIKT